MNTILLFRPKAVALATVLLLAWTFNGCKKNDYWPPKKQYPLAAKLTGGQEVPPNNSKGLGTLVGSYNSMTRVLTYKLIWVGLTTDAAAMHFHGPALPGVNAGIQIGIDGFPTQRNGHVWGKDTLTMTQAADLLAGKWYVNIHNANFPGGEIRGQVIVKGY